jgi:hypothetical protein
MVVSSLSVFAGNQQEAARQAMELVDVLPKAPSTFCWKLLQAFNTQTGLS